MDLRGPTREVIKKDSVAAIHTQGLVGDQYVEITFGSAGAASVGNGDVIAAQPQLADLPEKTSAILDSARGAVDNINDTSGNLDAISLKINEGRSSVGALINDRSHMNTSTPRRPSLTRTWRRSNTTS